MEPEKDIFDQWAEERAKKPWIIRKLRFIPSWWYHEGRYYHKVFKTGVKNLLYWFPVIWKDRNWDSNYIFEIMIHKLKAQSKYIGERDIHTRAKRDAEIMMTCVRLMKLVQEETYSHEYSDYHKTKHFFEELDEKRNGEKLYEWKSNELSERFDEYFKKYPRQYKKAVSGELKRFRRDEKESENKRIYAMEIAHENQERCQRLLFKLLDENIRKWWD